MSWYGGQIEETRKLDTLLDSNPTLQQLLAFPSLLQQLQSYNPRLLQLLSESHPIMKEIIVYITEPPKEHDTDERKYRLPLYACEMITAETTCLINNFFKANPEENNTPYLVSAFRSLFSQGQVLPLLAGYFFKVNLVLISNRSPEAINCVYAYPQTLLSLVQHFYCLPLVNTLQLYLLLDVDKFPSPNQERINFKLLLLNELCCRVKLEYDNYKQNPSEQSLIVLESISELIVEVVDRYYLIADGKLFLEIIMSDQHISTFFQIVADDDTIASCITNIVFSIIRYYTLSSYNIEEKNTQLAQMNRTRLQSQPMLIKLPSLFVSVVEQLRKAQRISTHQARLIDILNLSMCLLSPIVARVVKETCYIQLLLDILFLHQHLTIVQKLIDKLFMSLFNSDNSLCKQYKQHFFVGINIIELTVGRYMSTLSEPMQAKDNISRKHQGYFGNLMRIIRTCSNVNVRDLEQRIDNTELEKKFIECIAEAYEKLYCKELGTYEAVSEQLPTAYSVQYMPGLNNQQQISKQVFEEITREQLMTNFRPRDQTSTNGETSNRSDAPDILSDNLLPLPLGDNLPLSKEEVGSQGLIPIQNSELKEEETPATPIKSDSESFADFLNKQKKVAGEQLRLQRSQSQERKLSAQKTRMMSPSPKRKNKWQDNTQEPEEKKKTEPVVPPRRGLTDKTHRKVLVAGGPPLPPVQNTSPTKAKLRFVTAQTSASHSTLSPETGPALIAPSSVQSHCGQANRIQIRCVPHQETKECRRLNEGDRRLMLIIGLD